MESALSSAGRRTFATCRPVEAFGSYSALSLSPHVMSPFEPNSLGCRSSVRNSCMDTKIARYGHVTLQASSAGVCRLGIHRYDIPFQRMSNIP